MASFNLGIYVKFLGGHGLYVKNTSSQVHAVDQQGARTPEQFGIFLEQPSSLSATAIIGFAKKRRGVIGFQLRRLQLYLA